MTSPPLAGARYMAAPRGVMGLWDGKVIGPLKTGK